MTSSQSDREASSIAGDVMGMEGIGRLSRQPRVGDESIVGI